MPIIPELRQGSPIFIVGEAPGKSEEMIGKPFVGQSGQELDRILKDAGIERSSCSLSNVFLDRPENNDLETWQVKKPLGVGAPIQKGKWFPEERYKERERLYAEIEWVKPNVVLALGNTALWALCDLTGIVTHRGTVRRSPYITPKIIATMHPAAILRQWDTRPLAVMDCIKARRESTFPEIHLPAFKVLIEPTITEVSDALQRMFSVPKISYDIETAAGQITCIGFAMPDFAICIPFVSYQQPDKNYWTEEQEIQVWRMVRTFLERSECEKVTQNGLYDIQYLLRYKIKPHLSIHDTMLLHHSIQPELPKSLAFLGSVYTNFPSWKGMRPKGDQSNKKEE